MTTKKSKKIVILATGGTIAGLAPDAQAPLRYEAAVLPVTDLLAGLSMSQAVAQRLSGFEWVSEQVAQIDSKGMTHAVWRVLAQRCAHHLNDPQVQGIVITHGTDTAEETAFFLQCVLRPSKPVALTCAMLPANAAQADGPANLRDALAWVAQSTQGRVSVVVHGQVHAADWVQKVSTQAMQAFSSGPHHPIALIHEGQVQPEHQAPPSIRVWPAPDASALPRVEAWPTVEVVFSHAGVDGSVVRALLATQSPPDGWVVAATGAGSVHPALEAALLEAHARAAVVWRASRCVWGEVVSDDAGVFESAGALTPAKARIALMLSLMSP